MWEKACFCASILGMLGLFSLLLPLVFCLLLSFLLSFFLLLVFPPLSERPPFASSKAFNSGFAEIIILPVITSSETEVIVGAWRCGLDPSVAGGNSVR